MSKKKVSWDDIPSIEGLEVDWDFEPESPLGKRAYCRLTTKDLYPLFRQRDFPVSISTGNLGNTSLLMDISEGGMSIRSDTKFLEEQEVFVSFSLGNVDIIANGIIRMVREVQDCYFVGIEFTGLQKKIRDFIKGLYSSANILR